MITFNELKITPDAKHLIIEVSVRPEPYYNNVYIDSIVIDDEDTFVGLDQGPSENPVYSYTVSDIYNEMTQKNEGQKYIALDLDHFDLKGPLNRMFFIYVRTKGAPSSDVPCGMDNVTTMGTVVNMYPFYQNIMNYFKELSKNCEVPQNFIDYLLKIKGVELGIQTGNYADAISLYKKHLKGDIVININGGCHCGN